MKARVKATGEIVDAEFICTSSDGKEFYEIDNSGYTMMGEELDFESTYSPDYWTRLEHQYAGMAMQTMLATLYNPKYHKELMASYTEVDAEEVARLSKCYAHALIQKLKEKEE